MKTVGILGGMGPEATVRFFELLVRNTAAARDQDHVPVVVCSLPQIPDRTAAIVAGGDSPLPHLIRAAESLRAAGADFGVMPCISAHYFLPELERWVALPFLSLLAETAAWLRKVRPGIRTLGLLATTGTLRAKTVQAAFGPLGFEILLPSAPGQKIVMEAVYGAGGVKAGSATGAPREAIRREAERLARRGAGAVLAGCTEVSLVLRPDDLSVPLVDPLVVGARACVRRAGGRLRTAAGSGRPGTRPKRA
jgi:aspartate racemase